MSVLQPDTDIDARILAVEQRLIAREARLREGAAGLAGQLRQTLQPQRLLLPAGGVVLGIAALLSLRRRHPAMPAPPRPPGALPDVPWTHLLGLAWPMLPERWRHRINPAVASSLVTLGLPLAERLLGVQRRSTLPLATVAEVDLARLGGRWFLVGELPVPLQAEALQPPELGLLPRDDGQFDLLQRRIDRHGTQGSEARVQPVPGSRGARLRVSRWPEALQWLDWAWTEQAVLHVDEAYDEVLIGSPERDSLWLLSRRPELVAERRQALVKIARDSGFAVQKLRFFGPAA